MAISATFQADFRKWDQEFARVKRDLKSFEVPVGNVQQALKRMVDGFSGAKIQREAQIAVAAVEKIGGVTKLTDAEQRKLNATVTEAIAKYRALGIAAPESLTKIEKETRQAGAATKGIGLSLGGLKGLFAGAFAGIAVGSVVKDVIALGGELSDLSSKTGIGVKALQEFKFAGGQVGVSLDSISSAVGAMQKRVAGGDESAVAALKKLGLSIKEFRALRPEDQFQAVADKIQAIEDPAARAKLAMDVMGKGALEVMPLLVGGLGELRNQAERLGLVLDEKTVANLDDLGDSMDTLKMAGQAALANALVPMVPVLKDLAHAGIEASKWIGSLGGVLVDAQLMFQSGLASLARWIVSFDEAGISVLKLQKTLNPLSNISGNVDRAIAELTDEAQRMGYVAQSLSDDVLVQLLRRQNQVKEETQATVPAIVDVTNATNEEKEAIRALKKAFDDLSGAAAVKQMRALAVAWNSLSDAQRNDPVVQGKAAEAWLKFGEAAGTIPPDLHKVAEALNGIAASRGLLALPFEEGIKNAEKFGKIIYLDVGQAFKGTEAEAKNFQKVIEDLDKAFSALNLTVANNKFTDAFADSSAQVAIDKLFRSMDLLVDRDKAMNDAFMKASLTSTSYRVAQAIYAGEQQRRQLGLTQDEIEASKDLELLAIVDIVRGTGNWKAALEQVTRQLHKMGIEVPKDLEKILKGIDDVAEKSETFGEKFGSVFKEGFKNAIAGISDIIVQALIHGTSVIDTVVAIASQIGAAIGEALGTAIGGKLGGAIGKAVGSLLGPLIDKLYKSDAERAAEEVGRKFGKDISEGLSKEIEETMKTTFAGMRNNRWAAEVLHLGDVLDEVGLTAENFNASLGELRQAFVFLDEGTFTSAQAVQVLDESFGRFVDFLGGNVTPALKEIIALNDQFGLHSQAIADYVDGEARRALGALGDIITSRGEVASALGEAQAKLDKLRQHHGSSEEIKKATAEVAKLQAQLAALPLDQGGAEAFGAALFGIFERLTKDGVPALDVIKQIDPLIESLDQQLKQAGLSGGAAFDQIKSLAALATDEIAGPALSAVSSFGTALEALNNANILDPAMFKGIADQVGATVAQLEAQGKTAKEIYPFIANSLQTIWELQQDYGYAVDENTQKLLDQAEADGVVGEKHRSVQEQMLLAMNDVRDVLVGIGELFGVTLPEKARQGAGEIQDALDGIDAPDLKVNIHYDDPGFRPQPDDRYVGGSGSRPPGFAGGTPGLGFMDFGRESLVRLHGREAVIPADKAALAAQQWGAGSAATSAQSSVVILQVDGRELARAMVPTVPPEARRLGIRVRT